MPNPIPPEADHFRDIPLPSSALADQLEAYPARLRLVQQEIARVQRGECLMIPLHLDPLCAFYFVCALQLALTHPGHSPGGRDTIERIALGLETHIGEQCPALARVLADSRAIKGGQR